MASDDNSALKNRLDRRTLLSTITVSAVGGLAGCLGDGSQDATNTADTPSPEQTPSESSRAQSEETSTATPASDDDQTTPETATAPPLSFDHPDRIQGDEVFDVEIAGLPSGETAEITLTGESNGMTFSSTATVETGDGEISLADASVVDGDVPTDLDVPTTVALLQFAEVPDGYIEPSNDTWTYSVDVGDETLGSTSLTRDRVDVGAGTEPDHEELVGQVFTPASDEPRPGVLVLHGSGGRPRTYTAARLAQNGYTAFALHYFDGPGLPRELVGIPVEYVQTAGEWLRDHDSVRGDQVGVTGTSRGGELAMLAASEFDVFGPVVSIVGSGLVWPGGLDPQTQRSSWALDGEALPHMSLREEHISYDPTAESYTGSFEAAPQEEIEAATIPVENIDGPLLMVSGGQDGVWNSQRFQEVAAQRMENNGRSDYEHLVYDEAGHFIYPPYYSVLGSTTSEYYTPGGTIHGNALAIHDHWPNVLETLSTLES
jgi:nucleolar protein 56